MVLLEKTASVGAEDHQEFNLPFIVTPNDRFTKVIPTTTMEEATRTMEEDHLQEIGI